jgi:hypothetical protein
MQNRVLVFGVRSGTMRYSIFLIVVLCAFSACGGGSSPQVAKLRVVFDLNIFPNPPSMVTIDGNTVVFPQPTCPSANQACTMDYLTVPAGGFKFAAQYPGDSTNFIPSQFQTLSLAPNTQNTFFYNCCLFLDDGTPAAGSAKLPIANLDNQVFGPLEAWVNSNGSTTGSPTMSGVKLDTASGYVTLPPGPYILTLEGPVTGTGLDGAFGPGPGGGPGPITLVANQNVTVYLYVTYLTGNLTLTLADD